MSEDTNETNATSKAGARRDRWIKIGFLAVFILAATAIWYWHRQPPTMKGWGRDLDAALKRAAAERRQLLVFFISSPPSATTRKMVSTTLAVPGNRKAIKQGRFITVAVEVDSLKSQPAETYKLNKLPTMVLLSSQGVELNRREGFIGEVDFRNGFLDLTTVKKP